MNKHKFQKPLRTYRLRRVLHSRDQVESQVREDRVDGVGDYGRRAACDEYQELKSTEHSPNTSFNVLGPSPSCCPGSPLDGGNGEDGGHPQAHLHWLVARDILRSHRYSSSVEV